MIVACDGIVLEDIEADGGFDLDLGVVDLGGERDLGRLEGVIGREDDREEEDATSVGRVSLYAIEHQRT